MANKLSNAAVRTAMEEGPDADRQDRVERLRKQLERVKREITEEEEFERRFALVHSAFFKLKKELGKTLTAEEYQAIDGAYIFLHSGSVDLVRHVPSASDKGESKSLEKVMDAGDVLQELQALTEKAK